jgi:PAS domain S-box-containing protein
MGDEGHSSESYAEQLRVLFRQLPIALAVNLAIATIMATVLAPVVGTWPAILWFASILVMICCRYALYQWYLHPDWLEGSVRRWDTYSILGAGLTGSIWGIGGVLLLPPQTGQQVFVVLTIGGMSAGAVVVHSSHFPTMLSFLLAATIPVAAHFILEGSASDVGLGGMMLVFACALSVAGYNLNRFMVETIRLKLDLVRGEGSLRESEERFRAMANSSPALLYMSGTDKLCSFVNQSWLEFRGRTLKQELGSGWTEGVHLDDAQNCLETYHSAFDARRPFEMEYRIRRHDGEYRWVLDVGRPRFSRNGEFLGYTGSVLDITDRKAAEESNRAQAHVQRLAIMGELTAAVAHELRQPSAAIMSNAEAALALLETGKPPLDEMREIVTDIKEANMRANEVLSHIHDFLRKREIGRQPLDLNAVVADVLLFVTGDARKRRIQIRTELAEGLPVVMGNRTHLQQVLFNLIANAMDAMSNTPQEQRKLVIRTSKPNGDARVEVAVSDSGSGVTSGNLPRLFDSFFTTKTEGMGLGLSIARSIVESHGGRIWADNNSGGGATFHFTVQTLSNQ